MRPFVFLFLCIFGSPSALGGPCRSLLSGPFDDRIHDLGAYKFLGPPEILKQMKHAGQVSAGGPKYEERLKDLRTEVWAWHRRKIRHLERYRPTSREGFKTELSMDELNQIFHVLSTSPVTAVCRLSRYDLTQKMDLCFGRAAAAYIEARLQGLHRSSVKKIWMNGKFSAPNVNRWTYHVASAVLSKAGWLMLDPLLFPAGPVSVASWHEEMMARALTFDHGQVPELFITSGHRFLRDRSIRYHQLEDAEDLLSRTYFNDYFTLKKEEFNASRRSREASDVHK